MAPRRHPPARPAVDFAHPPVLARLLVHLDWTTLHAFLDSSADARNLFHDVALRDLILARFIPGFKTCIPNRHLVDRHPQISIYDLHLFLISQNFPLHLYPSHALRFFSSFFPNDAESQQLALLTEAHSRVVLLLQSLVHSSLNPSCPPEFTHPTIYEKLSPTLPELTFPAPLSYASSSPLPPPPPILSTPKRQKSASASTSPRRLTFFKNNTPQPPPPPPQPEPRALRTYSISWRRSLAPKRHASASESHSDSERDFAPPRRRYVANSSSNSNSSSSPSRSSTPTPATSSASDSPPPSFSPSPSPSPTSPHDFRHATSPTRAPVLRVYVPCSSPSTPSHTIVKCEEQLVHAGLWAHLSIGDIVCNLGHVPLSESDPDQDLDLHFRRHLSLPARPHPMATQAHTSNWLIFNGTFLVPFEPQMPVPVPDALTLPSPFYYTHILPRLENPTFVLKRMPRFTCSPPQTHASSARRHASHAHHHSTHPRQSLSSHSPRPLPAIPSQPQPHAPLPSVNDIQLRLVHLPTRVPTMNGCGCAVVRRYMWIARVFVFVHRDLLDRARDVVREGDGEGEGEGEGEEEMGKGWEGEWILEGEGTKEGREALVEWIFGTGGMDGNGREREGRVWELVRERCAVGRIWLKLLDGGQSVDFAEV
ncbi:hypothetical protein Hypma_006652 [Hypsizygus marmoreus]|uniref:Uncharacterized protein n=1 Tax=Hypsizygus marmoreus TaxID=39966 RepID=A0A369JZJ8_HYPMA|nr:hypothetical protein Hypma_006652 [Hypsizygus marmoreus]